MKFDQPRQIGDSWLPVAPVPWSKGSSSHSYRYDVLHFCLPEKSAEPQNHALRGFINYCYSTRDLKPKSLELLNAKYILCGL